MLTYVGAPYSKFKDKEALMKIITGVSARLLLYGEYPICPLTLGHNFCKQEPELAAKDSDWWMNYCYKLMMGCSRLVVLMLPGWEVSLGLQAEIAYAKLVGMPIEYIKFDNVDLEFNK